MDRFARVQSLLLQRPRHLAWVHSQLPNLGSNDLLLHTRAGAISLGTELPLYRGQSRHIRPPTYPIMTGYETVADVVARGSAVQTVTIGDRVVAFYGHRTAAVVPESRVVPIPPDISDRLAVLLILACDTAKGIGKVPLHPQSRVVITGSGTIGLLTLVNLHARGLREIMVIDPVPHRRIVAQAFGAHTTVAPNEILTPTQHYQVGFECSSRNDVSVLMKRKQFLAILIQ